MALVKVQHKTATKLKNNDEFTEYLKSQCLKTTFNGIEVDSFAWYKKMLGIHQ